MQPVLHFLYKVIVETREIKKLVDRFRTFYWILDKILHHQESQKKLQYTQPCSICLRLLF